MANKLYNEESIRDIANAIRTKNGTENTYNVSEMADAILAIVSGGSEGGITPTGSIDITNNGTYDVTNYASAIVNVLAGGSADGSMTFGSIRAGIYIPETQTGLAPLPNPDPKYSVVIEHNMGVVPDVALLLNITPADTLTRPGFILSGKTIAYDFTQFHIKADDYSAVSASSTEGKYCIADETTVTFGGGSSAYIIYPSHTYLWIAASEDYADGSGAPTGTIEITENGRYNVTQYASATVDVPVPEGTLTITSNMSYDVTNYATAIVNVPIEGVSIGPWATGTFQFEDVDGYGYQTGGATITVTHNLGFAPSKIMVMADEYADTETFSGRQAILGSCKMAANTSTIRKNDNTITYSNNAYITNITETTFDFGGAATAYILPCAWTYRWFAMA